MAQLQHLATAERARNPIPPRIADMVAGAIAAHAALSGPVGRRLDALARGLEDARNPRAARRHFARVLEALAGQGIASLVEGRSVAALHFVRLRAGLLRAAWPAEEAGLSLVREVRLAGKKGAARASAPFLEVTAHALGRWMQRSGREDTAALNQALCDAGRHAQALLPVLCGPQVLPRLAGRGNPVVLPTEGGAFLGFCRIGRFPGCVQPVPLIEAATWMHGFDLGEPQRRLLAALESAAPEAAVARGLLGLATPIGGDRRAAAFPFAPLSAPPDVQDELQLLAAPALLAPRLSRGEVTPEAAWRDLEWALSLR